MKAWLYRFFIELTNHKFTSNILKRFAQSKWSKPFIPSYAKIYNINQEEMLHNIHTYANLHDFFTRKLKSDARQFSMEKDSLASPVDGVLEDYGKVEEDKVIVVKGKEYSIKEMVGNDERVEKYIGGTFLILYLSPSHYHRIHSPVNGKVLTQYELGTKSYPVNRYGLKYGKAPLSKNFRVVTELMTQNGHVLFVKVGAMFINSIECIANHQDWQKGEEIAYFSFGSTVVLLFEKDIFKLKESTRIPYEIQAGEILGYFIQKKK